MAEDLKQRVHDFWQANPCGTKFAQAEIGSREFFEAIERHRYETEFHIPEVIGFAKWRGQRVLEIGCGLGTDGINFARAGADYTGIDLTEASIELVSQRFAQEGQKAELRVADAEALPFEEASFDLVYSHGVLHHTPDMQQAIKEVHRVLRPGGTAMVMLYHQNSYNYYVNIMLLRRLGVQVLAFDWGLPLVCKLTGEDEARLRELQHRFRTDRKKLMSRAEFINQNTDGAGNPLARVFTRQAAHRLFAAFREVEIQTHFLNKRWLPVFGKWLPRRVERKLAQRMGWHLWVLAKK